MKSVDPVALTQLVVALTALIVAITNWLKSRSNGQKLDENTAITKDVQSQVSPSQAPQSPLAKPPETRP